MDTTYSLIIDIISRYLDISKTKVFIFGSRATDTNRPFSDIDVGLIPQNPIENEKYFSIIDDLDNSDIPYRVELVDFTKVDEKFKQVALKKVIHLN